MFVLFALSFVDNVYFKKWGTIPFDDYEGLCNYLVITLVEKETRLMFQVLVKYVLQVTVVERNVYGCVMPT